MTPPIGGESSRPSRLSAVLRGVVMVAAVVLGALAVWLIVTSDTQKGTRIGALVGFWALLLAAFAVFGTRHPHAQLTPLTGPGHELDLRVRGELSRADDAVQRREYEHRLEAMLRREIQVAMGSQIATLRAEVAALRGDLVEKVGGQLRLERIETTRVIGSDIEALQHEVRQLMVARQSGDLGSFSVGTTHTSISSREERPLHTQTERFAPMRAVAAAPFEPRPVQPDPLSPHPLEPEPLLPHPTEPEPLLPQPTEPEPLSPQPVPPEPFAGQPVAAELIAPQPFVPQPFVAHPPSSPPFVPQSPASPPFGAQSFSREPLPREPVADPRPAAAPAQNGDPFASMPRLRPFTDFELDPVLTAPPADPAPRRVDGSAAGARNGAAPAPPPAAAVAPATPTPGAGRHWNADATAHPSANGAPNGSANGTTNGSTGRRRRATGDEDDMLARILHREGVR